MQVLPFSRKLFILLILPLLTDSTSTPPPSIKVKAVPPIYSLEVKDVTLYEATIPIFFHVKLPKIPDVFPSQRFRNHQNCSVAAAHNRTTDNNSSVLQYNEYHCALERQFILASNHIVKDLKQQMEKLQFSSKDGDAKEKVDDTTEVHRPKRQAAPVLAATSLVAGFLLRPAISKFTGNLFGSNEEWATNFNALRESLIKEHELLLDFEESTAAYTQEMSSILTTMSELLSEQKHDLIFSLHLLATKMHADMIQDAIHSCKTKHLPGNLIKPEFLRKSLSSLNRNLTEALNYTLAISTNDEELGKYYKLPIVDCLFTKDTVHITLNVPMKSSHSHWKLFEVIHTKYAFHHQICEVYPREAAYLAEDTGTGRSVLITNHMLRYCSIYEDKLCMVPRLAKDTAQSLKCTSMATNSNHKSKPSQQTVEDLLNSCSFRCYTNDEVIITQVDDARIVVTNAVNLTYHCGTSNNNHHEKTIHVGRLGAVEVKLECDCFIKINGEYMLPQLLPCTSSLQKGFPDLFTVTVPFMWALNLSKILEQENRVFEVDGHDKLGAHVNHDWPSLVAVLNFTKEQKEIMHNFTIPEKVIHSSSILPMVEVWLGVLTVIVLLHIGLTFYCCFRLFIARFAEYELAPRREREAWFGDKKQSRSRSRTPEVSHNHHHSHSNRNSQSSNSSTGNGNRRHNFDTYQKRKQQHDKLDDRPLSIDVTTVSLKSQEDTYHNNRHSISNRLV